MQNTLSAKIDLPESLINLYKEIAISPADILRNYALNHIQSKIHKYAAENAYFVKKYSCRFNKFKEKINKMKNEENFEWEDDLLDWQFAVESLRIWQRKERTIK